MAATETNSILVGALEYYKRYGVLTPKYANVVFWRLATNRIDHQASFFKIELKRQQHIDNLQAMTPRELGRVWPALSSAQRKKAIALGHTPPFGAVS